MSRTRVKLLLVLVSISILTLFVKETAFAYSYSKVLGVSVNDQTAQIPPTTEGPGLVLPDSPLFFLDEIKQTTRVFFAFTPEAKTKVYKEIAGERLAELRFMLAKNNTDGIRIALQEVSDNFQKAADELSKAKLSGKNVSNLAKAINDDIKLKQQTLDLLENKSTGELKARTVASSEVLLSAKIKVEDALPQEDLENEINYDLNRYITRKVARTLDFTSEINYSLDELNRQVAISSQNALKNREEALKKAIDEKNDVSKKEAEKLLELEKKKQEKLLSAHSSTINKARDAVVKTQQAVLSFQEAQQTTEQIKNQLSLPTQLESIPSQSVAGEKSQ